VVTIPQKANTMESVEKQLEFENQYKKLKEELKVDENMLFLDGVHPTDFSSCLFTKSQSY